MAITVDVRDMLCAQALAVVSRAIDEAEGDEQIDVRCNADDVRRDLVLWARDRQHRIQDIGDSIVRLQRAMRPTA